jgi:hypothetical protein
LTLIRQFETSGENVALSDMLARNRDFEHYVANKKQLISFMQLVTKWPLLIENTNCIKSHLYIEFPFICLNNFTLVEGRKFSFQIFMSPPGTTELPAEPKLFE